MKIFFLYSILKKVGHISPSNLCELQIRPFRPLLLTFMNRKLGGTPNICAAVSFLLTQRIFLCSVGRPNVLGTEPKRYLFIIINLLCSGVDIYSKKRLCKILKDCAQIATCPRRLLQRVGGTRIISAIYERIPP